MLLTQDKDFGQLAVAADMRDEEGLLLSQTDPATTGWSRGLV